MELHRQTGLPSALDGAAQTNRFTFGTIWSSQTNRFIHGETDRVTHSVGGYMGP